MPWFRVIWYTESPVSLALVLASLWTRLSWMFWIKSSGESCMTFPFLAVCIHFTMSRMSNKGFDSQGRFGESHLFCDPRRSDGAIGSRFPFPGGIRLSLRPVRVERQLQPLFRTAFGYRPRAQSISSIRAELDEKFSYDI